MKTTLEELQRLEACKEGVSWFKKQKNKDTKAILLKLIKEKHFDWANWYVAKLFTHSQAVQYSVYSAEIVIKEFEKVFPEDKRPRQAIEAAKAWLKAPTEENRSAAWSAAESAAWSADAARYAAWSASWSARSAAWSAESAARSAARSAESAAESATRSAKPTTGSRIIKEAIKILGL